MPFSHKISNSFGQKVNILLVECSKARILQVVLKKCSLVSNSHKGGGGLFQALSNEIKVAKALKVQFKVKKMLKSWHQ